MRHSWIGEGIEAGGGERQTVDALDETEAVRLRRLVPWESWW